MQGTQWDTWFWTGIPISQHHTVSARGLARLSEISITLEFLATVTFRFCHMWKLWKRSIYWSKDATINGIAWIVEGRIENSGLYCGTFLFVEAILAARLWKPPTSTVLGPLSTNHTASEDFPQIETHALLQCKRQSSRTRSAAQTTFHNRGIHPQAVDNRSARTFLNWGMIPLIP